MQKIKFGFRSLSTATFWYVKFNLTLKIKFLIFCTEALFYCKMTLVYRQINLSLAGTMHIIAMKVGPE